MAFGGREGSPPKAKDSGQWSFGQCLTWKGLPGVGGEISLAQRALCARIQMTPSILCSIPNSDFPVVSKCA